MKDLQREILDQVASGKISPEEGAARLESLESAEAPTPARFVDTIPTESAPDALTTRKARVTSVVGTAEIVGDRTAAHAVAEAPHRAREGPHAMAIEHAASS